MTKIKYDFKQPTEEALQVFLMGTEFPMAEVLGPRYRYLTSKNECWLVGFIYGDRITAGVWKSLFQWAEKLFTDVELTPKEAGPDMGYLRIDIAISKTSLDNFFRGK